MVIETYNGTIHKVEQRSVENIAFTCSVWLLVRNQIKYIDGDRTATGRWVNLEWSKSKKQCISNWEKEREDKCHI